MKLSLNCTLAEFEAAPEYLQKDYMSRLLQFWQRNADAKDGFDHQKDKTEERDGDVYR